MEAHGPAWVPPPEEHTKSLCVALKLLDQADRAWLHDSDLGHRLTTEAVGLIGPDAVLTIIELQ